MNKKISVLAGVVLSLFLGLGCGQNFNGSFTGTAINSGTQVSTVSTTSEVSLQLNNSSGNTVSGSYTGTSSTGGTSSGSFTGTTSGNTITVTNLALSSTNGSAYTTGYTTSSYSACGTLMYSGTLTLNNNTQLTGTLTSVSSQTSVYSVGCGGSLTLNLNRQQ